MSYTAPLGNAVEFQTAAEVYSAPSGDAVVFAQLNRARADLVFVMEAVGAHGVAGSAAYDLHIETEISAFVPLCARADTFLPLIGEAVGTFPIGGCIDTSLPLVAEAWGVVAPYGVADGAVVISGIALGGGIPVVADGLFTLQVTGEATGAHYVPYSAVGDGAFSFVGEAVGISARMGRAEATLRIFASGSGGRGVRGAAAGQLGITGEIHGSRGVPGVVSGAFAFAASAHAAHGVSASSEAVLEFYAEAAGASIGVVTGAADAAVRFAALVRGAVAREQSAPTTHVLTRTNEMAVHVRR